MFWSFAYLVARNLFALVWLLARPGRSKELEILVLRPRSTVSDGGSDTTLDSQPSGDIRNRVSRRPSLRRLPDATTRRE